jgi:prolipoprotein diacylglyceryl transferase
MASHPPGTAALPLYLPSPPSNGFHLGPLFIHYYGLMYVIGITCAILITRRRWKAAGGDPALVGDVAVWAVPAGIIGGRIYFDLTTPFDIRPHTWWGPLAVWNGGLGIWGGVALAALVGGWRVRRHGASTGVFANAVAPALLVAQAIGRIGNYFNQELFGKPSTLPWAVEISRAARLNSGMPAQYLNYRTFQPSFLYELIWDLLLAAFLVWLGHHRRINPWGLFALYVTGYSGYRIFEESIRIDSSAYFLGLRLNMYVAIAMTLAGAVWFWLVQRRGPVPASACRDGTGPAPGGGEAARAGTGQPEAGAARAGTSQPETGVGTGQPQAGAARAGTGQAPGAAQPGTGG